MIGYLLFGGILILLAIAVVAAAVRSGKRAEAIADSARARKDAAIEALRGLEFEFRTGKVAEEEYPRLRRELEVEAVRARDEARAGEPDESPVASADTAAEPGASEASPRRTPRCTNCGNDLEGGESFCTRCGAALG